jgi:DNA adenine methylase
MSNRMENKLVRGSGVLSAPFPWFGGKSRVASIVWKRLGSVPNYVEPFFGSGSVLLGRSLPTTGLETINDIDGLVCNFWRAIKYDPKTTAKWADNPVNENDLHARHIWLVNQMTDLPARLEADPEWYDPKIAGWWVWGMACWIGGEFCSGKGPWSIVDSRFVKGKALGINRKLPHLGDAGRGVNRTTINIYDWFNQLAQRLAHVRVCCGDWSRICTPAVTSVNGRHGGVTGVFLDPPYADMAKRNPNVYRCDSTSVAHDVREWAIENGTYKGMRIALCGYEGEHVMPDTWSKFEWVARGGYSNVGKVPNNNKKRERIWFSPHCLKEKSLRLGFGLRK